jgi:hypothetical protein
MKKYIVLFSFIFVFALLGFNAKPASAYDSGCMSGDLFSRTTGNSCSGTPSVVACAPGDLFSSLTGQPCSTRPSTTVVISSISPASGSVGDSIVVTGSGFTSTNNNINFGEGYIDGFNSNGTTITFTVPAYIGGCPPVMGLSTAVSVCSEMVRMVGAGNYNVSVVNANGTSNSVSFAVTGNNAFPSPNPVAPVVSEVNGPQSLAVNQQGTWTISALDSSSGNLSYAVNWGDEPVAYPMSTSAAAPVTQQSASFTHSYATAGIFTPIFTVTNSSGLTAQTSLSVNVGGFVTSKPPISPSCPISIIGGVVSNINCAPLQVSPLVPGCSSTSNFSMTTGQHCGNSVGSALFSSALSAIPTSSSSLGLSSGIASTQTSPPSNHDNIFTSPLSAIPVTCTVNGILVLGSTGTDVSCLQEHLGLTPDGVFGPKTQAAVSAFQSNSGLTPDGIVGPKSIQALTNSSSPVTQ